MEDVNNKIHTAINESNFDTEIASAYKVYSSLGNMAIMHESFDIDEQNFEGGFRFKAVHLSEIVWEENSDGIVDSVYRKFRLTLKQAIDKFGEENLPPSMLEKFKEQPSATIEFIHGIFPRKPKDVRLNPVGLAEGKHRPIASVYVETIENTVVKETGYYEFPMHVVRWETMPGEVYGRGPGSIAIPHVRTLNKYVELDLQSAAKAVNPPMLVNQRDVLGSLYLRAGGVTVTRNIDGIRPLQTGARFDVSDVRVQQLQEQVKEMFFLDKLLLPPRTSTGEMTAEEIRTRTEQMQRVFGPTMGRLNGFLSRMIERSFKIMLRSGALPPIPDVIREQGLDVEIVFVNQLARAQQFGDITNILGYANETLQLSQLDPNAIHRFDADAATKHIGKVRGIPEAVIRNDDEVQEIIAQIQQQQAQAQALEAGVQLADMQSKTSPQQ
jgi:hypothetical protein